MQRRSPATYAAAVFSEASLPGEARQATPHSRSQQLQPACFAARGTARHPDVSLRCAKAGAALPPHCSIEAASLEQSSSCSIVAALRQRRASADSCSCSAGTKTRCRQAGAQKCQRQKPPLRTCAIRGWAAHNRIAPAPRLDECRSRATCSHSATKAGPAEGTMPDWMKR